MNINYDVTSLITELSELARGKEEGSWMHSTYM